MPVSSSRPALTILSSRLLCFSCPVPQSHTRVEGPGQIRQNYGANAQRASGRESERPPVSKMEIWRVIAMCNETRDGGGDKAILPFSKTETFAPFVCGFTSVDWFWAATTKANRKPFSGVQTIPQTSSTNGKNIATSLQF